MRVPALAWRIGRRSDPVEFTPAEAGWGDHLDTSELTAKNRRLTQRIARSLYTRGAAGLLYRSNLDSQPCVALFQGRASLHRPPDSEESLTEPLPELLRTCDEFDLILRHPKTG